MTRPRRDKVSAAAAAALLAVALAAPAAAQAPPDARWRTIETEHFRVTFPEGLETVGRLAADRAEVAWERLAGAFLEPPEGRVEVLVTDHVDVSNGFAGVTPYRRVTIYARPPIDGFALSHFDDWMELVMVHELAHVLHLDVTGPLGRLLRGVFGRVPAPWPFFPGHGSPGWVIEGLATYFESALTPAGRVHGTYHEMVLRTALAQGRFEDLDEASGASPLWPAGNRAYVYGSLFFDWLLGRHGPERVARFVEAVGGQWIPYRMNAAARDAFGVSFADAWDAWRAELQAELEATRARITATAPLTRPETLTRGARLGLHPSVSPDGRRLAYARADGRSDSHIRLAGTDGSDGERLTRTNGVARFDWTPEGRIVFSQLEYADAYHVFADLWTVGPEGDIRRLTQGQRLDHPSVAPDGRVVAVRTEGGRAYLVEVDPSGGRRALTEPRLDRPWAFPAVSPDGRWIAAVRWERGGASDLLVLDRDGGEVARVTRDRALDLAPAWAPDGTLLWASDRTGIANLYAVATDPATGRPAGPVRQVTNVLTGVAFPSVDPAGRWIHFSEYGADGWEVARLAYAPEAWFDPQPPDPRFAPSAATAGEGASPAAPGRPAEGAGASATQERRRTEADTLVPGPYRSWRTLRPRYWEPLYREPLEVSLPGGGRREVLGPAFGAATASADLVGRHALEAAATWSTSGGRADGYVSYRWAGLGNPVLAVTMDQAWDAGGPLLGTRSADGPADTLFLRERERTVAATATFLGRRFRSFTGLGLAGGLVWEERELLDSALEPSRAFRLERPESRLGDAAATLSFSTARSHAFALGLEEGVALTLRGRARRELDLPDSLSGVPGRDRGYREAIATARGYTSFRVFGYSDHVLAVRLAGGMASGPGADAFHFDVGGAAGSTEGLTGLGLFGGRRYAFPVRGYANGDRAGRTAWSGSAEYRFPVALVNEGWGLLPLHLDRLGGALFADAGNAWGPELGEPLFDSPRRAALVSAGAEATLRVLAFFAVPMDLRAGVALPFLEGRDPGFYLRLGASF